LRGTFAEEKDLALSSGGAIRHGGDDVEIALRADSADPHGRARLSGLIGVAFPSTPAQSAAALSVGFAVAADAGDRVTLNLNPRAILLKSNAIVGIGLGAAARLGGGVFLVGDYTPIVGGENTRDTTTGARKRGDVYGIALRLQARSGR